MKKINYWHTPDVYAAEDCEERNTGYGRRDILPKVDAQPVATYDVDAKRWDA